MRTVTYDATKATMYVECRECVHCGHAGINDMHEHHSTCSECDWTGLSPHEDICPGCAQTGTMSAACPKCSAQYRVLCDANIAAPSRPDTGTGDADLIEALLDAADEWANYVDVDRAPMTLRKYLERVVRASKGGE